MRLLQTVHICRKKPDFNFIFRGWILLMDGVEAIHRASHSVFTKSSRPISMRLISLVPAPIS